MKNKTLRKVKLAVFALAGVMTLVGVPRADAKEYRHHNHVLYGGVYPAHYNGPLLDHSPGFLPAHGRYGRGYR
jgi:hypothetical protein